MRSKFALADCGIFAALMALMVESCMYFGTGLGPFACDGHAGEKWSLGIAQHGQINQCEELEEAVLDVDAGLLLMGCKGLCALCMRVQLLGVSDDVLPPLCCVAYLLLASSKNACSQLNPVRSFLD